MLVFHNKGMIDLDAALTMGVSVKDTDSAIGYFGTGLKFAIATVLRNGGTVQLQRGSDLHVFTAEETTIRGEQFFLVCMDGERLGFTTQLGRNWEKWMAFREFASNCRDEDGEYFHSTSSGPICEQHSADATTFLVGGIDEIWPDRGTILLEGEPIYANDVFEIYKGVNRHCYYRGVRISQGPHPLAFTYNILTPIELTEDRTAKSWSYAETQLELGIGKLDDKDLLRRIMTCGDQFMEHHMNVPAYGNPKAAFREMARELTLGSEKVIVNQATAEFARASAIDDMQEGDGMDLSRAQLDMMRRAKWLLKKGGFDVEQFPIICLDNLGKSIHGLAKDGKIYIASAAFDKGTRELAATLFEEFAHLKSGSADCTRDFQNWFIDQCLIQIERQEGEPF